MKSKKEINLNSPEVARIHSHICSDGCVYLMRRKRSQNHLAKYPKKDGMENEWIIEYTNTSKNLLEEFASDVLIAFNRKVQWRPNNYAVRITSVMWIVELLQIKNKNSYNWHIPEFIINGNNDAISSWLRAFFDDEGTITNSGAVRAKSVNKVGLEQALILLKNLNILSNITGPNSDKSFYLYIPKAYSIDYINKIGFSHPDKNEKIKRKNEPAVTFSKQPRLPNI